MTVNLSIKNLPYEVAERLRRRAAKAHRSLQAELMAILERAAREENRLTPTEALQQVRRLGLETADEATALIRRDRDGR